MDVENLVNKGVVEEQIHFTKEVVFCYRLEAKEALEKLTVKYADNKIAVFIPADFTKDWYNNNVTGTSALHTAEDGTEIFISVEKDFKCLDDTNEDQSGNYANPKLLKV